MQMLMSVSALLMLVASASALQMPFTRPTVAPLPPAGFVWADTETVGVVVPNVKTVATGLLKSKPVAVAAPPKPVVVEEPVIDEPVAVVETAPVEAPAKLGFWSRLQQGLRPKP